MSPMTPAERQRKYYEKKKQDEGFRKNKIERSRAARASLKGSALARTKRLTALRVRNYRERRRSAQALVESDAGPSTSTPREAYKSRQALGKAVKRLFTALPRSPRKKQVVVTKIAEDVGLSISPKHVPVKPHQGQISAETKKLVKDFYLQDDISRQLPGKKDVKSIKNVETGRKEKVAKRMLMYNLREVHKLFMDQHTEHKIGLSKFCEFRPQQVMLVSSKSQEVCCCPYCENMSFLFSAVKWKNKMTLNDLLTLCVCDPDNAQCMKRLCTSCPIATETATLFLEWLQDNESEKTVKRWNGGTLTCREMDVNEFCDEMNSEMLKYVKHVYNLKEQSKALKEAKQNLSEGCIILQTDFAENYAIKHQQEVMAAHWTSTTGESVTIYTAIVHYLQNGEFNTKAIAVISNTMSHSSLEVQVFNGAIFDYLKSAGIHFTHLSLWTDGAAAHFKNRFSMAALTFHKDIHDCTAEWNFQESYHGKGPHDGVGALLKWNVYRRVLQGRCTVMSARDFYEEAKKLTDKTELLYVSTDDIQMQQSTYKDLWQNCRAAKSIQQCRSVKVLGHYKIELYHLSSDPIPYKQCHMESRDYDYDSQCDSNSSESDVESTPSLNDMSESFITQPQSTSVLEVEPAPKPAPGNFVLVHYTTKKTSKHYVAVIESESESEPGMFNVNYLRMKGTNRIGDAQFNFPDNPDKDEISEDMIEQYLPAPEVLRMVHTFKGVTFPSSIN